MMVLKIISKRIKNNQPQWILGANIGPNKKLKKRI